MTALDAALAYIARGWCPVPIPHRTKAPRGDGWQTRRIDAVSAPQYFNGEPANVGVLLGPASGGLTDVDLDCPEAIAVAPYILPKTGAMFGRASKRASHRLYVTDLAACVDTAAVQLKDPKTKAMLIELRIGGGGKGAQSVFPGSTHEGGEPIFWEESGEPSRVDGGELQRCVRVTAACALMARCWPGDGSRHATALVVGGFLARAGMSVERARLYVEAIARAAADPEWRDRRKTAADAATAFQGGKRAYGMTALREAFGQDIADRVAEWLDYHSGDEAPAAPTSTPEILLPLPYVNMSNWDNEPVPDQEWGVLNRFPLNQTAVFSGEGAGGKSTLALQLGVAHVLGRDWLGSMPELGPAIVIDAEDDTNVIHRRLAIIRDHYRSTSVDPDEEITFKKLIQAGLHPVSLVNEDATLAAASRSGKIEPTTLYKRLFKDAGEIRPKLISIASSANVYAGNEIDRSQVQQFAALLTRLAIAANGYVVLIAHPSLTGISTDTGLSGTTQWHNAVRARAYLKSIKPEAGEQPDNDLRELVFKKNQYGRVDDSVVLRYQNGLYLPVPGMASLDRAAREVRADDVFLDLLRRFTKENRFVGSCKGTIYAPSLFSKEEDARKAGITSKDLEAAMARLFKANKIWNEDHVRAGRSRYHVALKG
jgi:RecA-family ATPase